MKDENCIFCKIINGELPSETIYEDEEFKVILDISPSSLGHALIIPKTHVQNIFEIEQKMAGRLFELAVKLAPVFKEKLHCDGINFLQNNGSDAGQTVMHFHMHIIPRYKNDGILPVWKEQCPTQQELHSMKELLTEGVKF